MLCKHRGAETIGAFIILIASLIVTAIASKYLIEIYQGYKEKTNIQQIEILRQSLESLFDKSLSTVSVVRGKIIVPENTYIVLEKNAIVIYYKSPLGKRYPPKTILLPYPVEGQLPTEPGEYEIFITFRDDKFSVRYAKL